MTPRRVKLAALALVQLAGALLVARVASAQDSQYWTEEFGNRARLLGGAIVGDAVDMSACYYNPGGLALVVQPEILLAANVLRYETIRIEGARGEGVDATSSRFGSIPSLFAGEIKPKENKRSRIAYSFFTRQPFELRSSVRLSVTADDVSLPGGLSLLAGDFRTDQRLTEHWAGVTYSRRMSDHYAIGITPFIAVRSHRSRSQQLIEGLADTAGVVVDRASDFDYLHWRMLAKLGAAWDLDPWKFGVALTTPSVQLFGSGEVSYDRIFVSQIPGGPSAPDITSNLQDDLDADFHSPLSIAVGLTRRLGGTKVHLTAEWFDGVENTDVLDPEVFLSQPGGEPIDLSVTYEMKSVFNGGVGIEHHFNEGLTGYGSFRTDFSGNVVGSKSTMSNWDIYHVTGGVRISSPKAGITLGGALSFGDSPTFQRLNLADPDQVGDIAQVHVDYFRAMGILGFNFTF
jgi:hypothetical protein